MASRRDILIGASAGLLLPKPSLASGGSSVRFIQLTDTHFGQRNHTELTARLIDQIHRLPYSIDFAVHTGDIVNDLILDDVVVNEGKKTMSKLGLPTLYVPGNHDILRDRYEETRNAYVRHFGNLLQVHEYAGLAVVTVYTEPLACSFEDPDFAPLVGLERTLQEIQGKPIIVCHHTPSVGNLYNDREYPGWPEDARKSWIKLLNRHGVKGVLAGHFHRDEFHWLGEVPLYVCPPVSTRWGRQPAFRIFTFENGRLSYRTQYLANN